MRMSCNGCRVLRKGCSDDCSIRPCLQWIKSPESQANATVFLAKFYGRAGLMNLINAGPNHLRPEIFRSLLYEACGRILNPIYGSVGLLWSGSWQLCQAAVEAVLKGAPITPINSEAAANGQGPPLKAYDIRHVSKEENSAASHEPGKPKTRHRVRRAAAKPKTEKRGAAVIDQQGHELTTSHESSAVSHQSEPAAADPGESKEIQSMASMEMAEAPLLFRAEPESAPVAAHIKDNNKNCSSDAEMALELTLGLEPVARACHVIPVKKRRLEASTCKVELGLDFTRVN